MLRETGKRGATPRLIAAAAASGAAALVYELLWIRRLGELFGSTAYAVNIVLALFFAGVGLGGWWLGRFADRGRPLRLFVVLEIVVAVAGALFFTLAGLVEDAYVSLAPSEWPLHRALLLKAGLSALLLAVPTLAMGGTLPALVRGAVGRSDELATGLGRLYGANTVGAALGAAATVYLLIPRLGLIGSAGVALGLNALAIVLALGALRSSDVTESDAEPEDSSDEPDDSTEPGFGRRLTWTAAGVAGFTSVGLEVLWTRALSARFLSTVYSFATILTVFLVCLGLGSLLLEWLDRRGWVRPRVACGVLVAAGLSGLGSIPVLGAFGAVEDARAAGFGAFQLREFGLAVAVMALPTFLFGLAFPLLGRLAHRQRQRIGGEVGALYLSNTVGSVSASLVVGFVILPALGLRLGLTAVSWVAVIFALGALGPRAGFGSRGARLASAALLAATLLTIGGGRDVRLWAEQAGERLLHYEEGIAASLAVVEEPDGSRRLEVDNTYHLGATRTAFAQYRQGLIPLLLAKQPRSVLCIGLATGGSAGASAAWGGLEVDVLEIVPGLGPLLPFFSDANAGLATRLAQDPKVRLLETDARDFVRTTQRRYDVVIGDLFVPWRAGEGAMYTREHLAATRDVLDEEGLFCQWLPLYQLRPEELDTIVATFVDVFEHVHALWLYLNVDQPALGLVGSRKALALDTIADRIGDAGRAELLRAAGLTAPGPVLGSWVGDRASLAKVTAGATLETRARPVVEFQAPLRRFRAEPLGWDTLSRVLEITVPVAGRGHFETPVLENECARYQRSIQHFFEGRRVIDDDPAAALASFEAALDVTPEWGWIVWNLDQLVDRAIAGRLRDVADGAASALANGPDRVFGRMAQARIAVGFGELDRARALCREVLAAEPQNALAREILARIGETP